MEAPILICACRERVQLVKEQSGEVPGAVKIFTGSCSTCRTNYVIGVWPFKL